MTNANAWFVEVSAAATDVEKALRDIDSNNDEKSKRVVGICMHLGRKQRRRCHNRDGLPCTGGIYNDEF